MEPDQEQRLIENFRGMTEWEKSKFMRMLLRVRNGDARAERLMASCAAGGITRRQLFERM
jgi:hypothetical protein